MQRAACGDLVGADIATLDEVVLHAELPFLVIGARQIDVRRQRFAREPAHVDVPGAGRAHGAVHRHDAGFPRGVKHRLGRFRLDLAEAVPAAHVADAVHHASPGVFGKPVPIIESRVTSVASLSSLQPSVPAGRIGNTMKRVSAVESHTRISVSAGKLTPKSPSTPRGSLTARERYGAALYQTGGRPSTSHG